MCIYLNKMSVNASCRRNDSASEAFGCKARGGWFEARRMTCHVWNKMPTDMMGVGRGTEHRVSTSWHHADFDRGMPNPQHPSRVTWRDPFCPLFWLSVSLSVIWPTPFSRERLIRIKFYETNITKKYGTTKVSLYIASSGHTSLFLIEFPFCLLFFTASLR